MKTSGRLGAVFVAVALVSGATALLAPGLSDSHRIPSRSVLAADGGGESPPGHVPPAEQAASAAASACTGTIAAGLSRPTIRVCDSVTVTVQTTSTCAAMPVHFVIVASNGTALRPDFLNTTLRGVVDALKSSQREGLAIRAAFVGINGVVRDWCPEFPAPYSEGARTLVELTDDVEALQDVRFRSGQELCSDYVAGAAEAQKILAKARRSAAAAPTEIVMFFAATTFCVTAAPECKDQCRAREMLLAAGQSLQREVPALLSVCTFDLAPDPFCHLDLCDSARRIAPRSRYSEQDTAQAVSMVEKELAAALRDVSAVRRQTVVQMLPPGLEYLVGSASEPVRGIERTSGGTRLVWARSAPTATLPLTLTYRVRPLSEGQHTITGTMTLTDTDDLVGVVGMQPVTITVSGLCETPTPEPSPTATPEPLPSPPTATATATATSAVTAVPTRAPQPVYFPLALREECVPGRQRVDVVLVIDASTSMDEEARPGQSKLGAAREAVGVLLAQLHFDVGDQAAVVAFNDSATLLAPLTGKRSALDRALRAIETAEHTCLVCALDTAATELVSNRHNPANTPVLILLTDGKSNPRPVGEAVTRAGQAKRAGIVIFTIGLGSELDEAALEAIASRRSYFFPAPTADQLEDIYREIAVSIPCPAEQYWGRR